MDYNTLLELTVDLGYRLAMSGAETFRVEETVNRILQTYEMESEVFAIPNCLTVSIETPEGKPMTRMRRIGYHGNDLDAVEKYSNLSRRICAQRPTPQEARQWLAETDRSRIHYSTLGIMLGHFLGSFGFCILFGGNLTDAFCSGLCGLVVGVVNLAMDWLDANQFFRTISAAFLMALPAYALGALGIAAHPDTVIIGALMLLVPGLLFTNAMRDIIYGDTNSGVNRIMMVFLVAVAIALGTATAWNMANLVWNLSDPVTVVMHSFPIQCVGCLIGCLGFSIIFNIHGPGGLLCALGGLIAWGTYILCLELGLGDLMGYFWGAVISAIYSEIMARIRKYPAISYLVVAIFPLIPGAGVYYTMNHAVRGDMESFASQGTHTIAIAGLMAVGILLISTTVRLWSVWQRKRKMRRSPI